MRYDRRHGWRGAVSNLDINSDWKDALASAGNQSGIDTWRVAVVMNFNDQGVLQTFRTLDQADALPQFRQVGAARQSGGVNA